MCLRNGWVYAVPDTQSWFSLITGSTNYAGECCDKIENCPNAYDNSTSDLVRSGWKASSVTFASVDMAVHACPMKQEKCANMYNVEKKATDAANMGGYVIGLQAEQAWTTQDSCGYLFGSV